VAADGARNVDVELHVWIKDRNADGLELQNGTKLTTQYRDSVAADCLHHCFPPLSDATLPVLIAICSIRCNRRRRHPNEPPDLHRSPLNRLCAQRKDFDTSWANTNKPIRLVTQEAMASSCACSPSTGGNHGCDLWGWSRIGQKNRLRIDEAVSCGDATLCCPQLHLYGQYALNRRRPGRVDAAGYIRISISVQVNQCHGTCRADDESWC
jgi:hypothetical protein